MMKCIQYGHEIVALANLLPVDDLIFWRHCIRLPTTPACGKSIFVQGKDLAFMEPHLLKLKELNIGNSVAPVGVLHPKEGKSRLNSLEEEQAKGFSMYQSISSWAPLDHFAQGCSSGLDPPTMNLRKEGAVAELNQGTDQQ
ncbi:hypothetical protein F2Q69_00028505 [Brassica cretica]|uniref:Uncharacterized protein n=1 Tax=Brassica cretica TaxID=69181 RepID=A0A8S9S979_BRACR|nr:hypothetical protein F2Q69_00028505 [Brassica cretica]